MGSNLIHLNIPKLSLNLGKMEQIYKKKERKEKET